MPWHRKIDKDKLKAALLNSWGIDTCYSKDIAKWTQQAPSTGQCAITALVVQDYLGGIILRNREYNHYWVSLNSKETVDFTKDQFSPEARIIKDDQVKRRDILRGERAEAARTPERYYLLKARVATELAKLSPILMLFSSNSTEEYILDVLECLALPKNYAHHFRYQLIWLSQELRELLPFENEPLPNALKNATILVAYLKQKRIDRGQYTWEEIVLIRDAELIKAYRTGKPDDDKAIAHIYFKLKDHIQKSEDCISKLKDMMGLQYGKSYAFFAWADKTDLYQKCVTPVPFERISTKLEKAGFDFPAQEGIVKYF